MDKLLLDGKIQARPRSCHGELTANPSILKKMGLDISKMLTPSRAPFYGIVPGNAATPLSSVVLPVILGTKDNYRTEYIKFEVADFTSSYHAILGRPALAKFMAVPHYIYLLLKMPGKIGILTFHCGKTA
jgi:hypothetical protein